MKRNGFSLIELVIVIAVMATFAGFALDLLHGAYGSTARQVTNDRLDVAVEALENYSRDTVKSRFGNFVPTGATPGGIDYQRNQGIMHEWKDPWSMDPFGYDPVDKEELIYWKLLWLETDAYAPLGWNGPYLPNPQAGDLEFDMYHDGWGEPLYFANWDHDNSKTNETQAIMFVWSSGQDRVNDFGNVGAGGCGGFPCWDQVNDDIVRVVDCGPIFDEELKNRLQTIHSAMERFIEDDHSSGPWNSPEGVLFEYAVQTPLKPHNEYFKNIYSKLVGTGIITPPDETIPPKEPADIPNGYLFHPWRVVLPAGEAFPANVLCNYTSLGQKWPAMEVEATRP